MKKSTVGIITVSLYQAITIPQGRRGGQETLSLVSKHQVDSNHIDVEWKGDHLSLTSDLWNDSRVIVPFSNVRFMLEGDMNNFEAIPMETKASTNTDPEAGVIKLGKPIVIPKIKKKADDSKE
jgi:hypothetical protein